MPQIPLFGASGKGRSVAFNGQRLVNFIPIIDQAGKSSTALYQAPGLESACECGPGPIRAMLQSKGVGYVVSGSEFHVVSPSLVATKKGDLATSAGPAYIISNGLQVMIADGDGYVYDIVTDVFGQITDPDFPGAETLAALDGYGIFNPPNSQTFYITDLADFTSIDALQFASAESAPDDISRVFTDHGELWLFGTDSTEVWQNTGAFPFPFERIGGVRLERGCIAPASPAKVDNSVFWLGDDLIVYRADGYQPIKISSEQIDYAIGQMASPSDAKGWTYDQEGHKYYVLEFQADSQTWVYDVATQLWHERSTKDIGRWRATQTMYLGGDVLTGDYASGNIYRVSMDVATDVGEEIICTAILPSISTDTFIDHASFEVEFQSGVGLSSGQGSDPKVMIEWSDTQGQTWSNKLTAGIGKIGEYGSRNAQIRRLGQSLDRRYQISVSDPVRRYVVAAYVNGRGS